MLLVTIKMKGNQMATKSIPERIKELQARQAKKDAIDTLKKNLAATKAALKKARG